MDLFGSLDQDIKEKAKSPLAGDPAMVRAGLFKVALPEYGLLPVPVLTSQV